jgi:zinc transporter ZupT
LTAFGTGILTSAVIFQMVIESEKTIGIAGTLICFLGGAVIFTLSDIIAERKGGVAGILLGTALDSIPESLAIGASVAAGPSFVLALLIGILNVPEGIASYKEMTTGKTALSNQKKALTAIGIVSIVPIILGIIRFFSTRHALYNWINPWNLRTWYFLYAILRYGTESSYRTKLASNVRCSHWFHHWIWYIEGAGIISP